LPREATSGGRRGAPAVWGWSAGTGGAMDPQCRVWAVACVWLRSLAVRCAFRNRRMGALQDGAGLDGVAGGRASDAVANRWAWKLDSAQPALWPLPRLRTAPRLRVGGERASSPGSRGSSGTGRCRPTL